MKNGRIDDLDRVQVVETENHKRSTVYGEWVSIIDMKKKFVERPEQLRFDKIIFMNLVKLSERFSWDFYRISLFWTFNEVYFMSMIDNHFIYNQPPVKTYV